MRVTRGYIQTTKGKLNSSCRGKAIMWNRLATVSTATLMLSGTAALSAQLPTYEIMGFPVTQHQLAAVNTAYVKESSPTPTLTLGGMPASPAQIAILTPRRTNQVAVKEPEASSGLAAPSGTPVVQ
jgi:hypothetical protein